MEWKDEKLELQGQFEITELSSVELDIPLTNTLYHDGDTYWAEIKRAGYFLRLDLKNGTHKKYYFSDLTEQNPTLTERLVNATGDFTGRLVKSENKEELYVTLPTEKGNNLFKWSRATDQFAPAGFPLNWEAKHIFLDKKGNIIFLFKDALNNYRAILENVDGGRFDCSAIFKSYKKIEITKLTSPDFNREIIACSSKGIEVHTVKASEAIQHFLPSKAIRAITELPRQQILIATQDSKHFIVDGKKGTVVPYDNPECPLGWTTFHRDNAGNIWTHDYQNITKYNPVSNTCVKYPCQTENIRLFAFIDPEKIALVDREELLYIHDLSTGLTRPFKIDGKPLKFPGYAQQMVIGENNLLWVATSQGLWRVDLKNANYKTYGYDPPFTSPRFLSMTKGSDGRLWLGTTMHGLYIFDPNSGEVSKLKSEDGLPNNTVANILADDEGVFWVGTYNGISLVSKEGELIVNLNEEDGLVERENNRYATFNDSDGKLWIGTVNGVNYIDPQKIKDRLSGEKDVKIYLNTIDYFDTRKNQVVVQDNHLNQSLKIVLPASHRFLNLNFSLSNYFKPEQNQFSYMLEGINTDWIFLSNQHQLNLNNLPAGKYNLLLKGRDAAGNWTSKPLVISIHAKEYFYKQIWFYLLGLAFLSGAALLSIHRLRSAVKSATKTILEDKKTIEQQAENLLELDEAKSRFFTNISHEFRTPLTIISGMAGQIMDNPQGWATKGGQLIKQNSANLLNLVNQILDLRKLEAKEFKLNLVQGDVVKYLQYLTQSYEQYTQSKGLQLHFLPAIESLVMDYDPEKLLRIVSNLLSNAVKYTPDKGNIYLHVNQSTENEQPFLQLRVEDTGTGIAADKLPHIFDRFYQVDDSTTRTGEGTGIGLALTQELVLLMGGTIHVKSTPGKGTIFTVWLPITNNSPVMEVLSSDTVPFDQPVEESSVVLTTTMEEAQTDKRLLAENPTLLLVEDNPDIRQFLVACLENNYQLETATNGQEGIDLALEIVPDLIISDVMMPEKDGFELTETLKNDERTSHVPIILLTAKADMESKISGLKTGADAYLTKPFEQAELMVRLEKLFELRQKLQARYRSLEAETAPKNKEDEFVRKVRQAVLENISDDTFGIAQLCRAVGLSRAQLHNKLKALTGQSTSIFVRSIRLHKAKELLKSTDLNVSEVGYEVGFKNPSHFSSAYQEEFGVSPSKTRK